MTIYLTPQQVLFIHARLIETTGGSHGLRDLGLLQSAVARPQATFDGADLYPDLWHKAITATAMFLRQNGYVLQTTNEVLEAFVMMVVEERPSLDAMVVWLKENVRAA